MISGNPITADSFFPISTRPPYYHEYTCDPVSELNGTAIQVFINPEESWEGSGLNITIGNFYFSESITRPDNEYNPDGNQRIENYSPNEGHQFLIIPVHIDNIGENELCFDIRRMNLTESLSGIEYPVDEVTDFLPDPFPGGIISPGFSIGGEVAYQVPQDSVGFSLSLLLENYVFICRLLKTEPNNELSVKNK